MERRYTVQVTRLAQAQRYQAPRHFDMAGLRLQGHEASDTSQFWVGLSHFLPGGGAEESSSPLERVYVVLDGEMCVTGPQGEEVVLGRWDSVSFASGESRSVLNRTGSPASMLVVMPYPPAAPA